MQSEAGIPALPMGMPERTGNPSGRAVELLEQGREQSMRGAAYAAGRLGGMLSAVRRLRGRGHDLLQTQQHWTQVSRETVRRHPIASVAFALAAGVLLSRIAGNHHS